MTNRKRMFFCQKCGKALPDDSAFCTGCGAVIQRLASENKAVEPDNVPGAVPSVETETEEGKKKKVKEKVTEAKKMVIKNGKSGVTSFVSKKIVSYLLSALLGVAGGFTATSVQEKFKEDFRDYYYETFSELKDQTDELMAHLIEVQDLKSSEAKREYLEENEVHQLAKELYMEAVSYTSEDKDINRLHNQHIEICKEVHRLTSLYCAGVELSQDTIFELETATYEIETKVEVFKKTREELCEKYDIEISKSGVVK